MTRRERFDRLLVVSIRRAESSGDAEEAARLRRDRLDNAVGRDEDEMRAARARSATLLAALEGFQVAS